MSDQQLSSAARAILDQNWNGAFTQSAPSLYPHQGNWDTGFVAIGNAYYHFDRAMAAMRRLFRAQWTNGMLPQTVFGEGSDAGYFPGPDFWQASHFPHAPEGIATSGITMPPVHGFVLWRMYKVAVDKGVAKAFLEEMYPKVLAQHRYLYDYRDPEEEGLVYIRHPWEGGIGNSPAWESALERMAIDQSQAPSYERKDLQHPTQEHYARYISLASLFRQRDYDDQKIYQDCPFLIQDPLFNGILSWSNEALIQIGSLIGADIAEPMQWHELTVWSMNEKLWDEERGRYNAYDLRVGKTIPMQGCSGLIPLCGEVPTQEQAEAMLRTLESAAFGGKDPEVTLCPVHSLQPPDKRSPVQINLNWLLYQGLMRYDMTQMADRIRQHSLKLLSNYGFYEYFDPRPSETDKVGGGMDQFSCSAALCLDFLEDQGPVD